MTGELLGLGAVAAHAGKLDPTAIRKAFELDRARDMLVASRSARHL